MPQIRVPSRLIAALRLLSLGETLLKEASLNDSDAHRVADSLVEANLRGVDSHGIARLGHYLEKLANGSINAKPQITSQKHGPSAATVDGDHGLGQLVMTHATTEAMSMAKKTGAGWAAVKHSSHCGALAYYGLQAAKENMIGLIFTHVDPMVLPHGSSQPFCGTNPICIAAPGLDQQMLCLDMATSITPWNSVMNAATDQVPIPQGWGVDAQGNDTTDPNQVNGLYPFGQYKGSGLGLMIDVLSALLGGAPIGPDIPAMYGDLTQQRMLGGLVGAIDIEHFVKPAIFRQRVSDLIQRWGALPKAVGHDEILYPGEPEMKTHAQRSREGIPMSPGVLDELKQAADRLGVSWSWDQMS
ncbi:MAG: Ldh family oxidoreductase [Phycisphaeraceae bacterium]|nr:Ldh family oxidoreductase [Phycisphaeraceae bacterium]